jgi:hypothetical protein
MPNTGRLGILVVAVILAGCDAAARATPAATAVVVAPTNGPTVGPSPVACYDIEELGGPAIDVEFGPPASNTLFGQVVAAQRLDGTSVSVPDPGDPSVQDLRSVLGGVETVGRISTDDDGATRISDLVATGELTVDGEAEARPLPIRLDGTRLATTFPDIDGNATLALRVDFRDACYRLTSTATARLRIGSVATVAACPTAESAALDGYLRRLDEDLRVVVSGRLVPSEIQTGEWPWLAGNFASDSGTLFAVWDRDAAPIRDGPGDRLVFRLDGADAALTVFMTRFYTRSDAVHELEREIEPVVTRQPAVRQDGSVSFRLPDEPGRYVTFTSFGWETPCLLAGSVANFEVVVE